MKNSHASSLGQGLVYTALPKVCFLLCEVGSWQWGLYVKT